MVVRRIVGAFLVLTIIAAAPATAQDGGRLAACRAMEADEARLACYDALADGVAAPAVETPAVVEPTAKDVAQAEIDAFGARTMAKPDEDEEELTEIGSTVASITVSASNRALITLENGQVWRQLNSSDLRIRADRSIGMPVTIRKAALGSHKMKIGEGRAFKVKRVQ